MGLKTTNALVSIGVNGGSLTPQANAATLAVPASATLVFALQSTALVQLWDLVLQDLDNPQLAYSYQWTAGQQNQIAFQVGPGARRLAYTSTVSDGASSYASANGQVTSTAAASSGAVANVSGSFTQPVVWTASVPTTLAIHVTSTTGFASGQSIAIAGGGYYLVSAIGALSLTIMNTGAAGNAAPGTTIADGSTIAIAGQGAPIATSARLAGQVLALSGGTDTPQGHSPVLNVLSYGADPTGVALNFETALEAADADAAATGLEIYIPPGTYECSRPARLRNSNVRVRGAGHGLVSIKARLGVGVYPAILVAANNVDAPFNAANSNGATTCTFGSSGRDEIWYVPLSFVETTCVDGLSQLAICVQDYTPNSSTGGAFRTIAMCGGTSSLGMPFTNAWGLFHANGDVIEAVITTTKGVMTGTPTLTFSSTAHTIARGAGSWTADGFAIGQTVTIPFINGGGSQKNVGVTGVLTNVSASTLTFASGVADETVTGVAGMVLGTVQSTIFSGAISVTPGATHNISLTYDAGAGANNFKLWVDGSNVASATVTGNLSQPWWERAFVGADPGIYFSSLYSGPDAASAPWLPGAAMGGFRMSFGGTYLTTPQGKTAVYPTMQADFVSNVTLPDGTVSHPTGILLTWESANRSSNAANWGATFPGWIKGQTSVIRNVSLNHNGGIVWLPMGGKDQVFVDSVHVEDISLDSLGDGILTYCASFFRGRKIYGIGYNRGVTLDYFSYFSTLTDCNVGTFSMDAAMLGKCGLVLDNWAYGLLSEGCRLAESSTSQGQNGNWNVLMSGGMLIRGYYDMHGLGTVCVVGGSFRSTTISGSHLLNEGGSVRVAPLYVQDVGGFTMVGGEIGTVGIDMPNCVLIDQSNGGIESGEISFTGTFFGNQVGRPVFAFRSVPNQPVWCSGRIQQGSLVSMVDAGHPGPVTTSSEVAGYITWPTSADADFTINDPQSYWARDHEINGAHWTIGRNLVLANPFKGRRKRILNNEAQTATITPGVLTVAAGATREVVGNGAAWVTP